MPRVHGSSTDTISETVVPHSGTPPLHKFPVSVTNGSCHPILSLSLASRTCALRVGANIAEGPSSLASNAFIVVRFFLASRVGHLICDVVQDAYYMLHKLIPQPPFVQFVIGCECRRKLMRTLQ